MKKFISLFFASAIALSAAAESSVPAIQNDFMPKADMFKFGSSLNAFRPQKMQRPVQGKYNRTEDTRGASPIEGTWTFVVGDNYFKDSKGYVADEWVATVDENNMVTFTNSGNEFFKLVARYNPKTHSLNFMRRKLAEAEGMTVYQEPFKYNWEETKLNKQSLFAYYNEYEDAIVFQDDLGIAWSAYADAAGKEFKGYYNILDMSVCYHPVGGEWKSLGDASFTDGWLAPGFGIEDATYKVELQQNKDDENLYRLVNPYKSGPMADSNDCTEDGYIVFDVTDPDHVIFKFANAGYSNESNGCLMFFVYNYYGILCLINPYYTPEEILLEIGDEYPFTTFKEGKLHFDNSGKLPDVRFGLQYPPTFGYFWKDQQGNPATAKMDGGLTFPGYESTGIGSIGVDGNADVEYFNLQGVRVINPEPGQILIKRQGNTVTKEVVR